MQKYTYIDVTRFVMKYFKMLKYLIDKSSKSVYFIILLHDSHFKILFYYQCLNNAITKFISNCIHRYNVRA